jgi:hypothetical protein
MTKAEDLIARFRVALQGERLSLVEGVMGGGPSESIQVIDYRRGCYQGLSRAAEILNNLLAEQEEREQHDGRDAPRFEG